ncbi:ABC transporter permease [Paenarthrobacter sp. Z7-10]|uniref:ABC transporter permease n=1 Tax=Paenarthrobacter sp. Z7-10 TaxID=2787635 RepID=UPI0022A8E5A4|nr:ABC transporter permease [Paenarthrobacter sp. Z7-10]MCZ2404537.1 ABC transporter permease [Paenarthrobacter sp. Z7-10]
MSITREEPSTAGMDHGGGYLRGIGNVVGLELRQRLRSRGWFILLGIWFVLIGFVTLLSWSGANASREYSEVAGGSQPSSAGPMIFEIVVAFVLLFGLLVAPALSANAVNGDRSGGTLAILQVTLLTPGQILWGKFLASWIAALAFLVSSAPFLVIAVVLGGMTPGHILVSLGMLAVELAVVCGIGVGISGLANRPLFSIVVSYLTIAALVVGTVIAFALGVRLTQGTVLANEADYQQSQVYLPESGQVPSGPGYVCGGPLQEQRTVHTERVAWLLSLNPYVVVADAIPYPPRAGQSLGMAGVLGANGMLEGISQGARAALAGPAGTYPCAGGKVQASYLEQTTPMWPLGLVLQFLLAGGLMWLGWRALRTPSRKLARGTRIA